MIKVVIVGTAHMHVNEIAEYVDECADMALCAIADVPSIVDEGTDKRYTRVWNLHNIESRFGTPVYDDYLRMLDEILPDVAFIQSENCQKLTVARELASRGIDIIIEKPMAHTAGDARAIVALKEEFGVEILVNWPVTWRSAVRKFIWAIRNAGLGKVQKLRYLNGHTGPLGKGAKHRGVSERAEEMTDTEKGRTWWYQSALGGGAYLDILCYGSYFTRLVMEGVPNSALSVGKNLNTPFADCEDNVAAFFSYDNAFSVVEGTWTTPRCRIPAGPEAILENGVVYMIGNPDGTASVAACDIYGENVALSFPEDVCPYENICQMYVDHKTKKIPMYESTGAEFNADVLCMIDAAKASNAEGRSVAL